MGAMVLTSCESDRDDNPILNVPAAFTQLTPAIGDRVINLENSESVEFKAEAAPNYGFPTETSYWIEFTEAADFSDMSKVVATDTKAKSINYDAPANEIDLGIMKLRGYEKPEQVDKSEVISLNVRMVACLANSTDSSTYVYSNPQTIKVTSYFLQESLPQFWYMTGENIADGSWANDPEKIGTGMLPMYVKAGEKYNRFTGDGNIEYVGYFTEASNGFKVIAPKGLSNWNYGMCGDGHSLDDGEGFTYRNNDNDKGNITVKKAGYYRLTISTTDHTMKSEPYVPETPVKVYKSMKIGENDMAPVTTIAGGINHDWFATVTLQNGNLKFTAGDGTAWGADVFPCGIATNDGGAIPAQEGTYKIYFNDITGAYMFIKQK